MTQRLPVWIVGIVRVEKKTVKGNFTADANSNVMNYVKFTIVMVAAIGLKEYLEDQNILPKSVWDYIYCCVFLAAIISPVISLAMTQRPLSKKKKRHDNGLEAYQAAYAKYEKDRTKLLDWIETQHENKELAKQNFTNTDYAFKLYNRMHQDEPLTVPSEPKFSDFYQSSAL